MASVTEQLSEEEQWEQEMEETRAMIDTLREHVQEAERMGDEVRILLTSLNSTADIGAAAGQLVPGLSEAQGVEQYATAQLELIEARINISRLADDKRELVHCCPTLPSTPLSPSRPHHSTSAPHCTLFWQQRVHQRPLTTPVNDATDFAAYLRRQLAFTVDLACDATSAAWRARVRVSCSAYSPAQLSCCSSPVMLVRWTAPTTCCPYSTVAP